MKSSLPAGGQPQRGICFFLLSALATESLTLCGEGLEITQQSMRDLAEEVKRRGQARLAAERSSPR